MTAASAPGKVILFGEHAVVYGRPGIAVPFAAVQATAEVREAAGAPGQVVVEAPDLGRVSELGELGDDDPLARAVRLCLEALPAAPAGALRVRVTSTIPMAAGMGSGAAVTVALLRALSAHLGHGLPPDRVSAIAFEVERLHHGTPSGIDNTVVTYAQPVYFVRGRPPERLTPGAPLHLVAAYSGQASPTALAVGQVRARHGRAPGPLEELFDRIGALVQAAREALRAGQIQRLGELMDGNQALLEELGVSTPELERLAAAARAAGAAGAKLSGAGLGGTLIALAPAGAAPQVERALQEAGAPWTRRAEVRA